MKIVTGLIMAPIVVPIIISAYILTFMVVGLVQVCHWADVEI